MAAKPIKIAIVANARQAAREVEGFSGRLKRTMGNVAKWGAVGVTAIGAATVKVAKDVVSAASDAQQSLGATEQIFGKHADKIVALSNKAAESVGLSANEYRELSNVTGAMLKSSGMPLAKVTALTEDLNVRAADLAATFGGPTADAVGAIGSLLRGEADPIERYGISIKQSDVNARLAAKGLNKLTGSAKKTAEQQARIELLMEQSADSTGQFARESDTLAGKQQRLAARIENVKVRIGTALLPMMTRLVGYASKKLVPALERFATWVEKNEDRIESFGRGIGETLLPPLKALGDLATRVAKWLADLPGPVKEIGIQAAIAAMVLPRLTATVTAVSSAFTVGVAKARQFHAEMTYMETRSQRVSSALARLGGAARGVAGVGGMVALVQGSQMADGAMKDLVTSAGAAATGFLVGGPVGGAVFGLGTLLTGLQKKTEKAARAAEVATTPWQNYADTLDRVSGAVTRATRAQVIQWLQEKDLLSTAKQLGVSEQTLINGILGKEGAQKRLNAALDEQLQLERLALETAENNPQLYKDAGKSDAQIEALKKETSQRIANLEALQNEAGAITESQEKKREEIRLLAKIPKKVVTKFENLGLEPSKKQIIDLQRRFGLTPKKVRTALELAGVDTSNKRIKQIIGELKTADKTKVTLKGWVGGIDTATKKGARYSESESKLIIQKLESIKKAHPNLAPYVDRVRKGVVNATGEANKSTQVGNQLKQGLLNGMYGTGPALEGIMTSAVRNAIAAAKREARTKSPSRKTMEIGRDLGRGLVIGLARQQGKAKKAGKNLLKSTLRGFDDGSSGVSKAIQRVEKMVRKRIKGKDQAKREKKALKSLKDEFKALTKNGKQQDKIAKKLNKQRAALKQLRQEAKQYAASVRDSLLGYANIASLDEGHLGNPQSLLDQLRSRVATAERFATLIESLRGKLNRTSLDQLIAAGAEGGLAAAEALAAGGSTMINEVNSLMGQLTETGTKLGNNLTNQFHGAGIATAEGLVKGLEKRERQIEKAAKKLAKKLAKAVKKALGIKSPSRVFREFGKQTSQGLVIGLDDVNVRRAGRNLSKDLVSGFGSPRLRAGDVLASMPAHGSQEPLRVEIHLSAEQLSQVERGRRITADVSAYQRRGGAAA